MRKRRILWLVGLALAIASPARTQTAKDGDLIDARKLAREKTVEAFTQSAEDYVVVRGEYDFLLSKPFGSTHEAPELLMNFAQVMKSLGLAPGMSILDFGAGSCWSSRWLTQLGLHVVALDVSNSMMDVCRERYARHPVIGRQPSPRFQVYNGHKIELPDESIDRIICLNSFHHVPNPEEVLRELFRILKKGGIAGFAEPGPGHSRQPGAQLEMKRFGVLENDVDVRQIWFAAKRAGFERMELAVFNGQPFRLSLVEFEDYLNGGRANQRYMQHTRADVQSRRIFFLYKPGGPAPLDSRWPDGLRAEIDVRLAESKVKQASSFVAEITVINRGTRTWLPSDTGIGGVRLVCHLLRPTGRAVQMRYSRHALTPGEQRSVPPGETVKLHARIPAPPRGQYILEFDLESREICLFGKNGSPTTEVPVEVF